MGTNLNIDSLLKYFQNLKEYSLLNKHSSESYFKEFPLMGNMFIYFHDFIKAELINIKGIDDVLGWEFTSLNTDELQAYIHNDDRYQVYDITRYVIEEIIQNSLQINPYKDIISLTYRMKSKTGSYKWITRDSTIIEFGKNNIPVKSLSICRVIDNKVLPTRVEFNSHGDYSKLVNYQDYISKNKFSTNNIFTKREIEILSLTAHGKTSKEISTILYISEHTVNTHKRNMREKTQTKNISELVQYSIFKGAITPN